MMAYFKRWTSGLVSRVDSIVVQIENQEALVDSAIVDMQQRVARARVQLSRMKRDGENLQRRAEEATREATLWRDRARAEPDEPRALECLRRAKFASQRGDALAERSRQHQQTEERLKRDVKTIEQRLDKLREQRNTMRTRQTRAEALALLQSIEGEAGLDVEQLLERWDARITETEVVAGCADDFDALVEEYTAEEERASLLQELARLRQEDSDDAR